MITFVKTDRHHSGVYTCTAENSEGSPAKGVINLEVTCEFFFFFSFLFLSYFSFLIGRSVFVSPPTDRRLELRLTFFSFSLCRTKLSVETNDDRWAGNRSGVEPGNHRRGIQHGIDVHRSRRAQAQRLLVQKRGATRFGHGTQHAPPSLRPDVDWLTPRPIDRQRPESRFRQLHLPRREPIRPRPQNHRDDGYNLNDQTSFVSWFKSEIITQKIVFFCFFLPVQVLPARRRSSATNRWPTASSSSGSQSVTLRWWSTVCATDALRYEIKFYFNFLNLFDYSRRFLIILNFECCCCCCCWLLLFRDE